jgi:hypothetical protein
MLIYRNRYIIHSFSWTVTIAICDSYKAYPGNSKISYKNMPFLAGAATELAIEQLHYKNMGEHNKNNSMNLNCQ